ncbi:hypothetical protein H5410_046025 [Solanum commersonii]|uniref:Uncharacterized protein n=1 Tax=Solanum commersonii TaxID=4109 RepID=A0A9J5XDB2_SOLCO|nr:hypothetical protein H5410_046025 [Solanum commersonii]
MYPKFCLVKNEILLNFYNIWEIHEKKSKTMFKQDASPYVQAANVSVFPSFVRVRDSAQNSHPSLVFESRGDDCFPARPVPVHCPKKVIQEFLMGPSIPKDNGELFLTRTDVPETIIDVPSKEFVTQQLEVEYEEKFEDESANSSEGESENEYEDESENEYEDEFEDESEEEFEDDAP